LALARSISDRLGDTDVRAIAQHLDGDGISGKERVGLVFPTYLWVLPRMVAEFARKLRVDSDTYVFAITVCSGTAGRTLKQLRRALRSNRVRLRAGFVVREDEERFWPGRSDDKRTSRMGRMMMRNPPATAHERIEEIAGAVRRKDQRNPETTNPILAALMGPLVRSSAERMLRTGDADFSATAACVSCGTCTRVCPRKNVTLEDGQPIWHHDCETCYACLLWCPEGAITHRGSSRKEPAHHAEVTLRDMILR